MGGRTDGRTNVYTLQSLSLCSAAAAAAGRKCPINGAHVFVATIVVLCMEEEEEEEEALNTGRVFKAHLPR